MNYRPRCGIYCSRSLYVEQKADCANVTDIHETGKMNDSIGEAVGLVKNHTRRPINCVQENLAAEELVNMVTNVSYPSSLDVATMVFFDYSFLLFQTNG